MCKYRSLLWVSLSVLLDEVLEGVAVCPLLCKRGSASHSGEMTQTQSILHALLPTRLLLLCALDKYTHLQKDLNRFIHFTVLKLLKLDLYT